MIKKKSVEYSDTTRTFQGVIAWDGSVKGKRPVVLIAHAFGGQSEFEEEKAVELAKLGYLGFAIDMYGKGRRADNLQDSRALMQELTGNRNLLLERIQLALKTGMELELADQTNMGAIGFCFGGKCVLDLARSGAEVKGVVSFHGSYDKPGIDYDKPIKSSILILHGWDDPVGKPGQVAELAAELTERKADWTITSFGHTGHAFTNPKANSPERGVFYNKKSNDRAWKSMVGFFEEVFK